jgi:hypothetical protein
MFVVVQTKHGSKGRSWLTFPTATERDEAFERLKDTASKECCNTLGVVTKGSRCGCFWNGGDFFYQCGNITTFKVPTIKLFGDETN